MPPLEEMVVVRHQAVLAPVEGMESQPVQAHAVGYVRKEHLALYRSGEVGPDYIAYFVYGQLAGVDDHPGDPNEPDWIDAGMVSPRGTTFPRATPSCQWVRMQPAAAQIGGAQRL